MATLPAFLRPQPRQATFSRSAQRFPVALPADLFSLDGERTTLVLDLCERGAKLELPIPPRIGAEVILHCGVIEVEGEVVWSRGECCGIRFHTPLPADEVDSERSWSEGALARLLAR